ncbi:MAG TPA: FAD-dependent oxidoreductase, partial [Longimicrobium sp.]|nr:FAD-dependent oxidoreductase [Longimicrobium sp.]
PQASYVEIPGGNWQLPYAFLPELQDNLVMDARAIEIQWSDGVNPGGPKAVHRGRPGVYVRTLNEPVVKRGVGRSAHPRVEQEFTADFMVVTIPFSALRFVSTAPLFSYPKRRAIIELHYDSATKVLLEFSERFWEWNEEEWRRNLPSDEYRGHDSIGGGSVTDAPNRFIYFPSHRVEGSRGGVVLASYTWADDASRWDSIPAEDRYNVALAGLVDMYGPGIRRYFTGFGATQSWMEDYYAYGEAAVFTPGQLTTLHPHIPTPEGLVHFAGEHTSLKHAWIEGAIESGVRAALEIRERAAGGNS